MSNAEMLVFYFMACLSCLKDRSESFNEYMDGILEKTKNKLLIANLLMLDLKIRIDTDNESPKSLMEACSEILQHFQAIGCSKGEALILYMHGNLEQKRI